MNICVGIFQLIITYIIFKLPKFKNYVYKSTIRDNERLSNIITELEKEVDDLTCDKNNLAAIVHTDNKIIPALIKSTQNAAYDNEDFKNEIYAVKDQDLKYILVDISSKKNTDATSILNISVMDSGLPFDKEVLRNMGKKCYTTHQYDGGSGIGLITINSIMAGYDGSFDIIGADTPYKKSVRIILKK